MLVHWCGFQRMIVEMENYMKRLTVDFRAVYIIRHLPQRGALHRSVHIPTMTIPVSGLTSLDFEQRD